MSMRKLILALLLVVSFQVQAAGKEDLIQGTFDRTSRNDRAMIAKDILTNVNSLLNYLPAPTPEEIAWVESESAAIDQLKGNDAQKNRSRQYYNNPLFQKIKLKGLLDNIRDALECVINRTNEIRIEMYCWSAASFGLLDRNTLHDSVRILIEQKKLPTSVLKETMLGVTDGFAIDYAWHGRGILQYIITPHLLDQVQSRQLPVK